MTDAKNLKRPSEPAADAAAEPAAKKAKVEEASCPIKRQIEYYLGDENMAGDAFFREKIEADKEGGWLKLDFVLACNNVKKQGWSRADIAAAVNGTDGKGDGKKSESVECQMSEDGKELVAVRRLGNKALPAFVQREKKGRKEKKVRNGHEGGCVLRVDVSSAGSAEESKLEWGDVKRVATRNMVAARDQGKLGLPGKAYVEYVNNERRELFPAEEGKELSAEEEAQKTQFYLTTSVFSGDADFFAADNAETKVYRQLKGVVVRAQQLQYEQAIVCSKRGLFGEDAIKAHVEELAKAEKEGEIQEEFAKLSAEEVEKLSAPEGKDAIKAPATYDFELVLCTKPQADAVVEKCLSQFHKDKRARAGKNRAQQESALKQKKEAGGKGKGKKGQGSSTNGDRAKRNFKIANLAFECLLDVKRKAKEILTSRADGDEIAQSGSDFAFVKELLSKHHPKSVEKMKDFKGLKVDTHATFGNRCFHIIKTDGTCIDVGLSKCWEALETAPTEVSPGADGK